MEDVKVKKDDELETKAEALAVKLSEKVMENLNKQIKDSAVGKVISKKELTKTSTKTMSKEEKIVRFFKALTRKQGPDYVTIKALSEGTAADGGNLFPNEFRGLA